LPSLLRVVLAAALGALPGCTTNQGLLTIAAPYEVPLDVRNLDQSRITIKRDVEGSDTAITSILFIPTLAGPRLGDAVADAIVRGNGDVLTRAHVTKTQWWFGIGVETLRVRGNVLDLPEMR
jgi:hypothetical protein